MNLDFILRKILKKPAQIRIRWAKNEDVFEIIKLQQEVISNYGLKAQPQKDTLLLNIQKSYAAGIFLVAQDEVSGKLVACAALNIDDENEAIIDRIFVQRYFRHLGIGKELLTMLVETAKIKKSSNIKISIPSRLRTGVKFFSSFGFKKLVLDTSLTELNFQLSTSH